MQSEIASPADPAVIVRLCAEAGEPDLARGLIARDATQSQVIARLQEVADIRIAGAAAGRVCSAIDPAIADRFISAGAGAKHVKQQLLAAIVAAEGPEIRNCLGNVDAATATAAGNHGWDKVVKELNAGYERDGT